MRPTILMEVLSVSLAPPKKMGGCGCSVRQYSSRGWGAFGSAVLRGRPRRETTGAVVVDAMSRRIGVSFLKAAQSSLRERVRSEVRLGKVEGHEPCPGPGVDALQIAVEGGGSWSAVRGGFDCGPQHGTVRLPSSANKSSEVVGHIVNEDEKEDGPENAALGHACGYVAV